MSNNATPSNQKTIVLMVEVLPADAKGNRKIIVSGAPKEEMPIVRAGLFANRHSLLDEIYRDVMKRKPQVIKRAATASAKRDDSKSDDEPETTAEEQGDDADAEKFAQVVSSAIAGAKTEIENPERPQHPHTELATALNGTPSAELVQAVGNAWEQSALPIIENDPTQSEVQHG